MWMEKRKREQVRGAFDVCVCVCVISINKRAKLMIKKHRIYATFLTVRLSLCVGYKIRSLFDKRLRFRNRTNHNILMRVSVFSYEES